VSEKRCSKEFKVCLSCQPSRCRCKKRSNVIVVKTGQREGGGGCANHSREENRQQGGGKGGIRLEDLIGANSRRELRVRRAFEKRKNATTNPGGGEAGSTKGTDSKHGGFKGEKSGLNQLSDP